jgi:hypothetical protein
MAPKIDPTSDPILIQRYDELYNNSNAFKSRLHNVVTVSRALTLVSVAGVGAAGYGPATNTITVSQQNKHGFKANTEIRDDIFFELHNAKKAMAFDDIRGLKGYNTASLANDIKKAAGYALAVEWAEWNNVAECVILNDIVNAQAGGAGPLLPTPSPFRGQFTAAGNNWMKFANYLTEQIQTQHTGHYDAAAPNTTWIGKEILKQVAEKSSDSVEIYPTELNPPAGRQPSINSRGNPFLWDLIKDLKLRY